MEKIEITNLPLSGDSDDKKRLKVELVPMPSGDNPWRTREEYIQDRDKQNKLVDKQIKELSSISKSNFIYCIIVIITVLGGVLAILNSYMNIIEKLK